jgi:hypothetical protein
MQNESSTRNRGGEDSTRRAKDRSRWQTFEKGKGDLLKMQEKGAQRETEHETSTQRLDMAIVITALEKAKSYH